MNNKALILILALGISGYYVYKNNNKNIFTPNIDVNINEDENVEYIQETIEPETPKPDVINNITPNPENEKYNIKRILKYVGGGTAAIGIPASILLGYKAYKHYKNKYSDEKYVYVSLFDEELKDFEEGRGIKLRGF